MSFDDKKKFIDKVTKAIEDRFGKLSDELVRRLLNDFIDSLDRDGDVIRNTAANLRKIALIDKVYNDLMNNNAGQIVRDIYNSSLKLTEFNTDYFEQFSTSESKYALTVKKVRSIIDDRLGVGEKYKLKPGGYLDSLIKDRTVATQIKNLSYAEVLKGSGFKNFKTGLQNFIKGDPQRLGAFDQHYRTYAYDIYTKIDRTESTLMAKDLDLKYFIFSGGIIDTSRDFCKKRNGKVFTMQEAEQWVNDPWIQSMLKRGSITSYDPITDMGGFNCRHLARFISKPVAEKLRPDLKNQ